LVRAKVLVETTILLAASVFATRQDLQYDKPLKHHFFDRSMALVGLLRKHETKKIGLTTDTVTKETWTRLEKAIIDELGKDVSRRVKSVALDLCGDRLDGFLMIIRPEPIGNPQRVSQKFDEVVCMYKELTDRAYVVDFTTARAAAEQGIDRIVSPLFRRVGIEIHARQLLRDRSQLRRLRDPTKRPSSVDKTILAEAAYLHEKFNSQEPTTMFLASTDKMFSPDLRDGDLISDYITREIQQRFQVRCDWPERIAYELKHVYG
jgi:hypothetical protein